MTIYDQEVLDTLAGLELELKRCREAADEDRVRAFRNGFLQGSVEAVEFLKTVEKLLSIPGEDYCVPAVNARKVIRETIEELEDALRKAS